MVASRCAGYAPLGASFRDDTLKPFDKSEEAEAFLAGWLNVLDKPGAAAEQPAQVSLWHVQRTAAVQARCWLSGEWGVSDH
ncbi:MAG: hypothetical protein NZM94_00325 [Roseiflexus sp.]|nr:hypothetical protein [Roseiflexus sp.]